MNTTIDIFKAVQAYYEESFGLKTLVVENEFESRQVKKAFFSLGADVVSDRDVVTFDYLLTQKNIQNRKKRIVDDSIFTLVQNKYDKKTVEEALLWAKKFPEPFREIEIFDVLNEYFSSNDKYRSTHGKLIKYQDVIKSLSNLNVLPRSFIGLDLDLLKDKENYVFLSSLVQKLPLDFQSLIGPEKILVCHDENFQWRKQIDLYHSLKRLDIGIDFSTFRTQIDEVRFVLQTLLKSDDSNLLFLYPKNKGYENLFYAYQREYFEDQKFFYKKREKSFLSKIINELHGTQESVITKYGAQNIFNSNVVAFSTVDGKSQASLQEIMNRFDKEFTDYDLNLMSELCQVVPVDKKFLVSVWCEILSDIEKRERNKFSRIFTSLPIKDYSHFSIDKPSKVYVMGWGDHLFSKNGEKIFSSILLNEMERDLGLELASLNSSDAEKIMSKPLMIDSTVEKFFLYSEQSAEGKAVKPGILKILWDRGQESHQELKRTYSKKNMTNTKKDKLPYVERKISASSLQKFDECPYKFYLEKVLGLSIQEEEDYFLSAKEEGLLVHRALEELKNKTITKIEFEEIIEDMVLTQEANLNQFRKETIIRFSDSLWKILLEERSYLDENEIEIESEKFFSFYAHLEGKEFTKKPGGYKIAGVVDRVDISKDKEVFVYDYKRADTGAVSLPRYTGAKLSPQLFLYCLAVDKGFLGEFKEFLGFQYINVKMYKRSRGFVDKASGVRFAKEVPQGSAVTVEKYQEKMEIFINSFWATLKKIEDRFFHPIPNPAYSGVCSNCQWVGVCKESETFK